MCGGDRAVCGGVRAVWKPSVVVTGLCGLLSGGCTGHHTAVVWFLPLSPCGHYSGWSSPFTIGQKMLGSSKNSLKIFHKPPSTHHECLWAPGCSLTKHVCLPRLSVGVLMVSAGFPLV